MVSHLPERFEPILNHKQKNTWSRFPNWDWGLSKVCEIYFYGIINREFAAKYVFITCTYQYHSMNTHHLMREQQQQRNLVIVYLLWNWKVTKERCRYSSNHFIFLKVQRNNLFFECACNYQKIVRQGVWLPQQLLMRKIIK